MTALAPAVPRRQPDLEQVCAQARTCRRCELYKDATQTVFGEGPIGARIFFVAEQPGDKEDIGGRPLIGPAGQVFDACLAEAGINRERCYITNAVKHFRHIERGKRRLHQRPSTSHIEACRWWLQQEIELVGPHIIVALGAVAARAIFGKPVKIAAVRGHILHHENRRIFVTIHPSYLLRLRGRSGFDRERSMFLQELAKVAEFGRAAET
ncbi:MULTISPECIES: UdgX family uracil-DNA binding protein [unclassified Ochrobactrum]|uniref:UdgX family uracil-DNA binding protein n=1 Tax=unclassified Ochrobactrum TaxID=239106 RepID=UPI000DEEB8B5|nr:MULTISPECIES: UdgX family uracil-DNA binding protein [unclassified Ochrobactrum]MBQ0710366.1 UdgX family uracil-DNA binding protein [Ochrobactrum sp. AP1BH01-1]